MTPYIAEFILDSDLRLPDEAGPIKWVDGNVSLELWNIEKKPPKVEQSLKAHLLFESTDLGQAKEDCQDILANILNSLCLITMCSARQSELKRVVDWSEGLVMRDAAYLTRNPRIALSEPALSQDILGSARRLSPALQSERAQTALRWFRIGLSLGSAEEQFIHFWFALENAAEALKGDQHVAHKCPQCDTDLGCPSCGTVPTHRKFAAEAIRDLIFAAMEGETEQKKAFRTLTSVRHALMHGRRMASALKGSDMDEGDVTNLLAQVTRISLFKLIDPALAPSEELHALDSADVVRSDVVMTGYIQSVFGPPNKPDLSANEGIQVSVVYPGDDEA